MDAQWLKAQFELYPEKTKAGLARALSLEAPAISKILNNNRQIKASEYIEMRRFFGYPVESDANSQSRSDMVKLSPLKGLNEKEHTQSVDPWVMPNSLLSKKTQASPDKIKVFEISDSTMSPDFAREEQVLVDISDQKPSPPGVFVLSDGLSQIVRRCEIVPQSNPMQIRVSASNKNYEPYLINADQADIMGRVIAKLEWL